MKHLKVEKLKKLYIAVSLCLGMIFGGCTSDDGVEQQSKGLMPVLFSAGNVNRALTRAASASYMPEGGQFACAMFFHAKANDDNTSDFYSESIPLDEDVNMAWASMKISDSYGHAAYQDQKMFYWQNRLNHVFLGLADNSHIKETFTATVGEKKTFDLTRGNLEKMDDQPDPIMAFETAQPLGATPEANRVNLYFKHLFAQVQVNLKGSQNESAQIEKTQIVGVELLGVTTQGTVTFGITPDGKSIPLSYVPTSEDTPFQMFERATVPTGYLKSFECIAFGKLQGIRITWKESETDGGIEHVTTFKGAKDVTLESGKKYIYNLELRRSLIAQVSAAIKPWEMDATDYSADGTITE